MKKTTLIPLMILLGFLLLNALLAPGLIFRVNEPASSPRLNVNAPPTPQSTPDWIDVYLDAEYTFDNDSVIISWTGRPRTNQDSPFNSLYNWTKAGYIDGGIWDGNPGNATIHAVAWDNTTTASEVRDFLNHTMMTYVRYTSFPSLSIFNFTDYENQTTWAFDDEIASHEEFLNTTFYLVNNATGYLMDGFNTTGIAAGLTSYRIHLEWFENEPIAKVNFTYTIANVIEAQDDAFLFRLGRALGLTAPLNLTGQGQLTIHGPFNRVYLEGSPEIAFEGTVFPFYPIGVEAFGFSDETSEFDYTIRFQEGSSILSVTREFSTTTINRGDLISVRVVVENTGNTIFSQATVRDVIAIETGVFQLVSGLASMTAFNLQPGDNVTLEYSVMALASGVYEYPAVQIVGIDVFSQQCTFTSSTQSLTIGNGLTPNEITLIGLGVGVIIIVVILLILYRFRRRIF
ncbi:MAG: hypothetical protein ACFE9D_04120 [Promethearchaeota archaeon]